MRQAIIALVFASVALAAAPGAAQVRYSGRVVAVDARAGTLALEEAAAAAGPAPARVRRQFALTPTTTVELIERAAQAAPGAWPRAYTAAPLAPDAVKPGDFATITAEPQGGRLVAQRVSIVRPAEPSR